MVRSGHPCPALAVGIDVAEERKGLDLVALDEHAEVVASAGKLSVEEARDLVRSLRPDFVGIDSPSGWARSGKSRVGERHLRRMGISSFATGADPGDHPFYRWMRVGIRLFDALSAEYPLYRGGDPRGCAAEVFPAASTVVLCGHLRPAAETKIAFRRRVLRSHGVDEASLSNADRVDAALVALTGVRAFDGEYSWVGDPDEGALLLPAATLPIAPFTR